MHVDMRYKYITNVTKANYVGHVDGLYVCGLLRCRYVVSFGMRGMWVSKALGRR